MSQDYALVCSQFRRRIRIRNCEYLATGDSIVTEIRGVLSRSGKGKREGKRKGAPIIDPPPLSSSSLFRVLHVDTKNHHHHSWIDVIRRFRVKVGGRSRPSPPCLTRARFNPRPLGVETLEISWPRREESRRETFPKNSFA